MRLGRHPDRSGFLVLVRRHEILDNLSGAEARAGSALFVAGMAATDIEADARYLVAFQR